MNDRFTLAVHGGAGALKDLSEERRQRFLLGIHQALKAGYEILYAGGSSIDAVQAAVIVLENDETFNAGKGAVCASDGRHYLDASIMAGSTPSSADEDKNLRSGAVAGVQHIKNPIALARLVKDLSSHTLLMGQHADKFGKEHQLEEVANSYFSTEFRRKQLALAKDRGIVSQDHDIKEEISDSKKGTVGAVACDSKGSLAAATSTGGRTNKHPGRVGDSAIIGAGTYAEDGVCAVSATGWGELFLEQSVASQIACLIRDAGLSFQDAVKEVVLSRLPQNSGGVVAVNSNYEVLMPYNTGGMIRGFVDNNGTMQIGIHAELTTSVVTV